MGPQNTELNTLGKLKKLEENLYQKASELQAIFNAFPDLFFRMDSVAFTSIRSVEAEVIKIGGRQLQGFMNGCFTKDSDRCVVKVQSCQMPKNIPP